MIFLVSHLSQYCSAGSEHFPWLMWICSQLYQLAVQKQKQKQPPTSKAKKKSETKQTNPHNYDFALIFQQLHNSLVILADLVLSEHVLTQMQDYRWNGYTDLHNLYRNLLVKMSAECSHHTTVLSCNMWNSILSPTKTDTQQIRCTRSLFLSSLSHSHTHIYGQTYSSSKLWIHFWFTPGPVTKPVQQAHPSVAKPAQAAKWF